MRYYVLLYTVNYIMFPMIATLNDFRGAKALLEEKAKLIAEGVAVSDDIKLVSYS